MAEWQARNVLRYDERSASAHSQNLIIKRRDGGVVSTKRASVRRTQRVRPLSNLIIKRRDGGVVERARLEIVLRATVRGFKSLSLRQKGRKLNACAFFISSYSFNIFVFLNGL